MMYLKRLRLITLFVLIFVFTSTAFVADEADKNDQDSERKMIQYFLSNIKSVNDSMVTMLRDTVNSDPEKYLPILKECKGKYGVQVDKIVYQYILGLEKYKEGIDLIKKIGEIVNIDYAKSQLAIVETADDSNIGWIVGAQSTTDLYLMSKTLKIENYDTRYYEYKILDWRVIYEQDSGNYRGKKVFDSYYVAAEMGLWAWIGLCKKDYIASGLAYNASELIIYRYNYLDTQTKPNYKKTLEHGKRKIKEILADYKLKQIKDSTRFDNTFENILKSLKALNKAFSIKTKTKTEVESLTQQYEKTQKFLDDTSSEEEKNKPINKLIRTIINSNINCPKPNSLFYIVFGGSNKGAYIRTVNFPLNFVLSDDIVSLEIWDLLGDLLPQDYKQILELLNCDYISRGFFKVKDYISIFLAYFNRKEAFRTIDETITADMRGAFFKDMPSNRLAFYEKLHQTVFLLRSFALNELAQTNYNEVKKILLNQQDLKDINEIFWDQLAPARVDTTNDILRQFAVFMSYTNSENYDEDFFKQLVESKYNNEVLYVIAEMLWNKFQSTVGFNRLSTDLQSQDINKSLDLTEIKARINLLQVMSHTSKEHAEAFKALMLNLMESENKIVRFAIFQIFEKYGVPESFVEKVQTACNDTEILFHKPDVDNFPMMISNLAKSIIAQKNEMPGSYRPDSSYFDRKMMFEFIQKYLGKDNQYDELLKKYKVEKEEVPEDLSKLKQLIDEYLYSNDQNKKTELHDEILKSQGSWDALRQSGRGKSENELQILLKLADDVSRKIKVVDHHTNDKANEKFTAEINKLKGKSLTYLEMTELTKSLSIKFNMKEVAVYAERLPNGLGIRLMIYSVKTDEEVTEKTRFNDILAAKYTRNGISQLIKSTDFSDVKGENKLGREIEGISYVSSKFITSQLEFYYHIKH